MVGGQIGIYLTLLMLELRYGPPPPAQLNLRKGNRASGKPRAGQGGGLPLRREIILDLVRARFD